MLFKSNYNTHLKTIVNFHPLRVYPCTPEGSFLMKAHDYFKL